MGVIFAPAAAHLAVGCPSPSSAEIDSATLLPGGC